MRTSLTLLGILACCLAAAAPAAAQNPPREQQITAAVAALPEGLRAGAKVLGRIDGQPGLAELRPGGNGMICLADDPSDNRFHVACYHESLEPFMARGRELRAQGVEAADSVRLAEATAGTLPMPKQPAALYALTGPVGSFDPATDEVRGAAPHYVLYVPNATAESTGLPTQYMPGAPWLMDAGTASAHIMIVPPREESRN